MERCLELRSDMSRPSLKETVGTAVNAGNLASEPRREGDADRLAALARADPLGAALWRVKVGGDLSGLKRAAILLARRAKEENILIGDWRVHGKPPTPALLLRICECVINEWVQDKCARCRGRGRLGMGKGAVLQETMQCDSCAGSGRVSHIGQVSQALKKTGAYTYQSHYRFKGEVRTEAKTIEGAVDVEQTKPCPDCGGRGKVNKEKVVKKASLGKQCPQCEGTGQRRIVGAHRARVVRVSTVAYWKTWHERFREIWRLLKEADGTAVEDVRLALRGPRNRNVDNGS